MKSAAFALMALLFMKIVVLPIAQIITPSPLPSPAPTSKSFVGYGGSIMLPFLHNATLHFYAGEELWIMAEKGVSIRLTRPDGSVSYTANATTEPQLLMSFADGDPNGSWLLEQLSPEGTLNMTIKLEKYFTHEPVELAFSLEEDKLSAAVERSFQSLAALHSENGLPAITPGELVNVSLGTKYSGLVHVRILSMEPVVVEGYSGATQQKVEVTPLVAHYTLWIEGEYVEFRLPKIHEVGSGGLFPLRYGPIAINVTTIAGGIAVTVTARFYVFPVKPSGGLKLSNRIDLAIKEALNTKYGVCEANSTTFYVRPPVAKVRVFDVRHNRYLTMEEFNLKIGNSQMWYENNSAYVLYLNKTPVTKENQNLTVTFTYELKVGGFIAKEATPRTLILKPTESVTIITEANKLKVRIVDAVGNPVEANLHINGTVSIPIIGEASLTLPMGQYELQVISHLGNETRTISLEDDMEITFTLGQHDLILTILIVLGAAEALAIALLTALLIKTSRTLNRLGLSYTQILKHSWSKFLLSCFKP